MKGIEGFSSPSEHQQRTAMPKNWQFCFLFASLEVYFRYLSVWCRCADKSAYQPVGRAYGSTVLLPWKLTSTCHSHTRATATHGPQPRTGHSHTWVTAIHGSQPHTDLQTSTLCCQHSGEHGCTHLCNRLMAPKGRICKSSKDCLGPTCHPR